MTIMIDARRLHVSKRVCAGSPHNARTPTLHQLPTARSQWTTPRGGKELTPTHSPTPPNGNLLDATEATNTRRGHYQQVTLSRHLSERA